MLCFAIPRAGPINLAVLPLPFVTALLGRRRFFVGKDERMGRGRGGDCSQVFSYAHAQVFGVWRLKVLLGRTGREDQ